MSNSANYAHWMKEQSGYQNFGVSHQLFEALEHRPQPGKDISNLTFGEYRRTIDHSQSIDLCLMLQRLRLEKLRDQIIQGFLDHPNLSETDKKEVISTLSSMCGPRTPKKITERIKKEVLEMSQTKSSIAKISQACKISRGQVSKILKSQRK